jgi:predicted permease
MRQAFEQIWQDLQFAARYAMRTRLTTLTMVLVLSLGIGVNSALFTIIYSVTGKPAPGIQADDALVRLRGVSLSYPAFRDAANRREVFDMVGAAYNQQAILDLGAADAKGEGTVTATATYVSSDYFPMLGVRLAAGRGLPRDSTADRNAELVAIIDFVTWRDRYAQRADIVGQTIKVNSQPVTIVGVAPRGFTGHNQSGSRRIWLPLGAAVPLGAMTEGFHTNYDRTGLQAVGRLRDGVGLEQASRALVAITDQATARKTPRPGGSPTGGFQMINGVRVPLPAAVPPDIVPLRIMNASRNDSDEIKLITAVFGLLTLLVLLVTCTNVASLLAGAGLTRKREIAVRLSLGAPRTRIVRQLVTESVLVALAASAVGLALLWTSLRVLGNYVPEVGFSPDWNSIAFTAAFAIATAIGFSLMPALHATQMSVAEALKNTATNVAAKSRLQRGFVIAQITLTQPLLVLLGVLSLEIMDEARRYRRNPLGDRIISMQFSSISQPAATPEERRAATEARNAKYTQIADRLRATPGVVGVVPMASMYREAAYEVHPSDRVPGLAHTFKAFSQGASSGYFKLMGWPLLAGREFTPVEAGSVAFGAPVMVIRSDLARELWGSASPIGKRVRRIPSLESTYEGMPAAPNARDTVEVIVVGVVDAAQAGPSRSGSSEGWDNIFEPSTGTGSSLYVRTADPAASFVATLRAIAREIAPELPLSSARTLKERDDGQRTEIMLAGSLAGTGGGIMLGLACIGLYAVIAFAVGQRTREIGIRIALGQGEASVVGMFMKSGMILCTIGLAIGLPLTLIALKLAENIEDFDRLPNQIPVSIAVAITVSVVSAVAILIPARRAVTVDPLVALRAE